jgi:hypothetical protein
MHRPANRTLLVLLLIYGAASLIHFAHNAEFLADYPNLPDSWSRTGVYRGWLILTAVGIAGWLFLSRGHQLAGLLLLALYAVGGLDSLGHYVLAPLSAHTLAMNSTILFEVVAAALVFAMVMKQMIRRVLLRQTPEA